MIYLSNIFWQWLLSSQAPLNDEWYYKVFKYHCLDLIFDDKVTVTYFVFLENIRNLFDFLTIVEF